MRIHNNMNSYSYDQSAHKKNQLLIDVSIIIRADKGTGIQRVVRSILQQLKKHPPEGFDVRPIFASNNSEYSYVPESADTNFDLKINSNGNETVAVSESDIFLGLDLAPKILYSKRKQLIKWKSEGVKFHFMLYDLLPVLHPDWFNSLTVLNFNRWLRTVTILSDSIICISNSSKNDLQHWLKNNYGINAREIPIKVIPMSGSIDYSSSSKNAKKDISDLEIYKFSSVQTALMVGTIEPRKGYSKIIDAFEVLWNEGENIQLLIVGTAGWKSKDLQDRIANHPLMNIKLFWLKDVSDNQLKCIYDICAGLIYASEGEGYGLPIIEAVSRQKPVLVRKIPVFEEMCLGNYITYFSSDDVFELKNTIRAWLFEAHSKKYSSIVTPSWNDSARVLVSHLITN